MAKDKLYLNLDDSSDEEDVNSNLTQYNQSAKYEKVKKLKDLGCSNDEIKASFELHIQGLNALYNKSVNNVYYQKKKDHFDLTDQEKSNLDSAINAAINGIMRSAIDEIIKLTNSSDNLRDALTNEIFGAISQTQSAQISSMVSTIYEKRYIGYRAKKISDNDFKQSIDGIWTELSTQLSQKNLTVNHKELAKTETAKPIITEAISQRISQYNSQQTNASLHMPEEGGKSPTKEEKAEISKAIIQLDETTKAIFAVTSGKRSGAKVYYQGSLQYIGEKFFNESEANIAQCMAAYFNNNLKKTLAELLFERPNLKELHTFDSNNFTEFLANIRLSNRSIKRIIKEADPKEKEGTINTELVARGWSFKGSKQSVETQEISSRKARTDLVANSGNYKEVYKEIDALRKTKQVTEQTIIKWVLQILFTETGINNLKKDDDNQLIEFDNNDQKVLINFIYLLFGTETSRNPASLIATIMVCNMIARKELVDLDTLIYNENGAILNSTLSLKEALDYDAFYNEEHIGGGRLPMTPGTVKISDSTASSPGADASGSASASASSPSTPVKYSEKKGAKSASSGSLAAVATSSPQNQKSTKEYKAEIVPSARWLHDAYNEYMPYHYEYPGSAKNTSVAELVKRESWIVAEYSKTKLSSGEKKSSQTVGIVGQGNLLKSFDKAADSEDESGSTHDSSESGNETYTFAFASYLPKDPIIADHSLFKELLQTNRIDLFSRLINANASEHLYHIYLADGIEGMHNELIKIEAKKEIQAKEQANFFSVFVLSLFNAVHNNEDDNTLANHVVSVNQQNINHEYDNNIFNRITNWFMSLIKKLGYEQSSDAAVNMEFTFLQMLYETIKDSGDYHQFIGFPHRYPDFDPDDDHGYGGNDGEDNTNNIVGFDLFLGQISNSTQFQSA